MKKNMYKRSVCRIQVILWHMAAALFIALAVVSCTDQLPNVARPFVRKTDLIADNWQLEQVTFCDESQSVLAYSASGSASFTLDRYDLEYVITTIKDGDTVQWEKSESGYYVIGYEYTDTISFAPEGGSFWDAFHSVWGASLMLTVPAGNGWFELNFTQPLDSPLVADGWDACVVPFAGQICIADCRNSGKESVYGIHYGSHEGTLYEYLWENETWLTVRVAYLPELAQGYKVYSLTAACCRDDNSRRIYSAIWNSDRILTVIGVYESEFSSGAWQTTRIAAIDSSETWYIAGFASADVKGTGTESLLLFYKSGDTPTGPSVISEISHENSAWIKRDIPLPDTLCCSTFTSASIAAFAPGAGDTDDRTSLYAAIHMYDSTIVIQDPRPGTWPVCTGVYRYLLQDDSTWQTTLIDSTIDIFTQGNVNVIMPALASDSTGGVWIAVGGTMYEYIYNGTDWTKSTIIHHGGDITRLCVADIRRDGSTCLYLLSNTGLYEYTLQAGSWVQTSHISDNSITNITAGKGRGDGIERLYVDEANYTYEVVPE